jgi:hypothetical protein
MNLKVAVPPSGRDPGTQSPFVYRLGPRLRDESRLPYAIAYRDEPAALCEAPIANREPKH